MRAASTFTDARIWTFEFIWRHLIDNPLPDWGLHGDQGPVSVREWHWRLKYFCRELTEAKFRFSSKGLSPISPEKEQKIADVNHIHDNLFLLM